MAGDYGCGCLRACNVIALLKHTSAFRPGHPAWQHLSNMANHHRRSSPSPAASLGSDAMSESAASSPPPAAASPVDDGPLYPLEGKFISVTDKAEILALPEIERESILADRAAENLKRQQDVQLQKALAATQAAASKHKRKAAAAQLDDDGREVRKSTRAKVEKTGRSALDDYKKAREAKGAERTSRFDVKKGGKRSSRSPSSASDRDADGESEVEWAAETLTKRDEPSADLKDFDRCRVGRSSFAKVHFYPNFEETMKGCFCRVSIGMNKETGQNMYRMTQIKGESREKHHYPSDFFAKTCTGFKSGKPYSLELPNGKTFTTDAYAIVAHGNAEKQWPFSACSDSKFTDAEFQRYIDTLSKERLRIPKKAWLMQKVDDINRFLEVKWTDDVLQGKFARQKDMERRTNPANAAAVKKESIEKQKAKAEEAGDEEEIARCEAELAALENNATNGSSATLTPGVKVSSPMKPKTGNPHSAQDRLVQLSIKNRGKSSVDVRNALLAERKKLHQERERAFAEEQLLKAKAKEERARLRLEAEMAKNGGGEQGMLAVPGAKAVMRELFGDSPGTSRAGTPMSGVSTPLMRARSRAGTPMNGAGVGGKKSGLGKGNAGGEDELGGLDLGIDVEI